jgi:hypothetical protein
VEQWRSGNLALVRRVAPLIREVQLRGCFQTPPQPGSYLLADFPKCLVSTALRAFSIKQHAMPGQAEAAEDAMAAVVSACLQALAERFPGWQALELRGPVFLPAAVAWAPHYGSCGYGSCGYGSCGPCGGWRLKHMRYRSS